MKEILEGIFGRGESFIDLFGFVLRFGFGSRGSLFFLAVGSSGYCRRRLL